MSLEKNEIQAVGSSPSPEQLAKLPLLSGACSEALRIHPVVPIILRRLQKETNLRGCQIPKGDSVGVALTQLHLDPEVFPEPTEFKPERFVNKRFTPFQYAPFGGGASHVIAAHGMARGGEIGGHGPAHIAQTDKTNFHACSLVL